MTLKILKMDNLGRGIGYLDKIVFVPNTLIGEEVEIKIVLSKKNYYVGEVINYLKTSNSRIKPICPYYDKCGGCHLQHLEYLDTLKYKIEKVKSILSKEKIVFNEIEIIKNENPYNYRNKVSLKIDNFKIGFYEEKSNSLIQIDYCYLADDALNECLKYLKRLKIKNGSVTLRCNYNKEILMIIDTFDKVDFKREYFPNIKVVGVVLNNKKIYGEDYFYERINGYLFKVSFDAFFQVNPYIASSLFKIVDDNLDAKNVVYDLYSGVGTLGIVASKKAGKVYSIEIIKNAVLNILENKKLNKVDNLFPILGDVSKKIFEIKDSVDIVLIDPPRKGCTKKTLDLLINEKIKNIIYISCDVNTLARDLKLLNSFYEIKKFYLLDMFSYTNHVECVCVLNRYK